MDSGPRGRNASGSSPGIGRFESCHNHVMPVRTTVDIPEPLHDRLKLRAQSTGSSIRSLIVRALEETYAEPKKGERVTGPLITTKGKLGPKFPVDENPYDLLFP
jgi:hypothetical protein